jgi:hypothetical protein
MGYEVDPEIGQIDSSIPNQAEARGLNHAAQLAADVFFVGIHPISAGRFVV